MRLYIYSRSNGITNSSHRDFIAHNQIRPQNQGLRYKSHKAKPPLVQSEKGISACHSSQKQKRNANPSNVCVSWHRTSWQRVANCTYLQLRVINVRLPATSNDVVTSQIPSSQALASLSEVGPSDLGLVKKATLDEVAIAGVVEELGGQAKAAIGLLGPNVVDAHKVANSLTLDNLLVLGYLLAQGAVLRGGVTVAGARGVLDDRGAGDALADQESNGHVVSGECAVDDKAWEAAVTVSVGDGDGSWRGDLGPQVVWEEWAADVKRALDLLDGGLDLDSPLLVRGGVKVDDEADVLKSIVGVVGEGTLLDWLGAGEEVHGVEVDTMDYVGVIRVVGVKILAVDAVVLEVAVLASDEHVALTNVESRLKEWGSHLLDLAETGSRATMLGRAGGVRVEECTGVAVEDILGDLAPLGSVSSRSMNTDRRSRDWSAVRVTNLSVSQKLLSWGTAAWWAGWLNAGHVDAQIVLDAN